MKQIIARMIRLSVCAMVVSIVLSRGMAHASTAFMFDFEADSGQLTTFTAVNNGVSATFSNPGGPIGFFALPTSSLFLTLSGNALFQATTFDQTLNILFDQDVDYIQLLFGSTAVGQLTLTAFAQNLSQVGQTAAASIFLAGGANAEGSIAFEGGPFRSLELTFTSSDENATFAIDDVTNAPEPATLFLLGAGAIMLGCAKKRLRARP